MEKKSFDFAFNIQKQEENSDFFEFEGLASTFSTDTVGDIVQRGAFSESLSKKMPKILFQHNQSEPIGVAVECFETPDGLFLKARLPKDDDLVRGRVIPQMRVGSLDSMSFGGLVARSDMEIKGDNRILKKIDLKEVSLVTFPANTSAKISAFKSLDYNDVKEIKSKREFEALLRDLGMSQKAAVYLASKADFAMDDSEKLISKVDKLIWSLKNE